LAIHPLLRIAILRAGRELLGSHLDVAQLNTSIRHGKIALSGVKAGNSEKNSQPTLFEAEQIVLDVDRRALAHGQIVIPRASVNGLRLCMPRLSPTLLAGPADDQHGKQDELEKCMSSWLAYAKQELLANTPGNCSCARLAQEVIQRWSSSLDDAEQRALAAQEGLRDLLHAMELAGENPLRTAHFYQQTAVSLDQLDVEIFEIRGEIERWRQQAKMDRDAIRAASQEDLAVALQPVSTPDTQKLTRYLLDRDLSERIRTAVTWLGWGRQFLPSYHRHRSTSSSRGRQVVFAGQPVRPDILIESLALRGSAESADATYHLEGSICGLSSHPDRNSQPTEVVLHTTGRSQTIIHLTLDARGGQLTEQVVVNCPRCEIAERKLGNPQILAIAASAGVCHYQLTMEQRSGQLQGTLRLQQPTVTFAPCFTELLNSPELAALVTDALRSIGNLDVVAELSGTWEHPQWSVQSNLGSELAQQLSGQLQARELAFHRQEFERLMLGLEAQLKARYEICSNRCEQISTKLLAEDGELAKLRATVASRIKDWDSRRASEETPTVIRR
jgi:uncharacterized protein (TIGR03545 family)